MQAQSADDLDLGTSFAGFVIVFGVGTLTLGALAIWWGVGGALIIGGCIAFLLLPFGLDTRLGGWLAGLSAPIAWQAWLTRDVCPSPDDDVVPLVYCDVIIPGWAWWALSLTLLIGGAAIALAARGRSHGVT